MNEFTLLNTLNIIKRHLLITIAIFFAAYWVLPSLNIVENKYKVEKIIKSGRHPIEFNTPLLEFPDINGILISSSFSSYLNKTIKGSEVSSFKITENDIGNMIITFQNTNPDSIVSTAKAVMQRLQEFDNISIQRQFDMINEILDVDREILEILETSDGEYMFTDENIEEWANQQKKYDLAIQDMEDFNQKYKLNLVSLMTYKTNDTSRRVALETEILNQKKIIAKWEAMKKDDFTTVSYLFPVSKNDISIYYPNPIIFFGFSLLVAFFYNLILLSYKYRESVK
ncbi:hypothetical protein [Candidatus Thioglobus sp. NP1]|uniref:hypothetical protein n=1 Tax=Candidatus Thioglobus sp. NP1 TaxID=2508687 RepID=UPI000DEDFEB0|nr:hypothetical protein [Candidatus Thioglobus sp. NP1]AXE61707.1 hypothetical protein CRN91_03335 [Candidatus Thioglobus sp. NP1]